MNCHVLQGWGVAMSLVSQVTECLVSPSEVTMPGCVVSGAVLQTGHSLEALEQWRVLGRGVWRSNAGETR